jgi:hypothetical protein
MKIELIKLGLSHDNLFNSGIINEAMKGAPPHATLIFPDGRFPINDTLVQHHEVNWDSEGDTTLVPTRPMQAALFAGGGIVKNIKFHGDFSIRHGSEETFPCIEVQSVMQFENIRIRNWWGDGFFVSADVQRKPPVNASHCFFRSIYISECKESGMHFRGGDSSQSCIMHVDVRDCLGYGIWDDSFLGVQMFAVMCHNNGRNYVSTNGNNRTGYFGCYSEGGRQPDQLAGFSERRAGINTSGVEISDHATVSEGDLCSKATFGDEHDGDASLIRINKLGLQFDRAGTTNGLNLRQVAPMTGGYPNYAMDSVGGRIMQFFGAHGDAPTEYRERQITFSSFAVPHLFIGNRLVAEGTPNDYPGFAFRAGDILLNPYFNGQNAERFVFDGWTWKDVYI